MTIRCLDVNHIYVKQKINLSIIKLVRYRKSSIFLLQEIFTSTEKTFISRKGLSTRQLFYEV